MEGGLSNNVPLNTTRGTENKDVQFTRKETDTHRHTHTVPVFRELDMSSLFLSEHCVRQLGEKIDCFS